MSTPASTRAALAWRAGTPRPALPLPTLARAVRLLRHVGLGPAATRYVLEVGWTDGLRLEGDAW